MQLTKRPSLNIDRLFQIMKLMIGAVIIGAIVWALVGKYNRGWWHLDIKSDAMTDDTTAEAHLNSSGDLRVVLECRSGVAPQFLLASTNGISDYAKGHMLLRFDRYKAIPIQFGSEDVVVPQNVPPTVDSVKLMAFLRRSQQLVIRNEDYPDRADEYFTLRGAERVVHKMEEACRK